MFESSSLIRRCRITLLILLVGSSAAAIAQTAIPQTESSSETVILPFRIHVTHLLGFEDVKSNAKGTLTVEDNSLLLYTGGVPAARVKIAAVKDVSLGEESKQVGGIPMTLGKAATPYGGGRVISLFSHKKYDTVALEYVDTEGGAHGAIFQLQKGQGELLRNELVAKGAHVSHNAPSTAEVRNESK